MTVELGPAHRKQRQIRQPSIVRKVGQKLLFKLWPGTAGDDRDLHHGEQAVEQRRHLGIDGSLARGQRAVEIEDDQLLSLIHI